MILEILGICGLGISLILATIKLVSTIRKSRCIITDDNGVKYDVEFSTVKDLEKELDKTLCDMDSEKRKKLKAILSKYENKLSPSSENKNVEINLKDINSIKNDNKEVVYYNKNDNNVITVVKEE
jgi:mRNA-degrading endonuclease RelE of RelBE toxin-antitoxin system